MDIGAALLEVGNELLQTFPFLGVQVHEFDAEVLSSGPGHPSPGYLDRLLVCRNVHTEGDGCTNLYKGTAFNGAAAR